jgi:anti-sigma regulatory factor (Ser/Thr protein kinase)
METRNFRSNKEITLSASQDELERLLSWVSIFLEEGACTGKIRNQILVVTEEIFVNIASYAYPETPGEVVVRISIDGPLLVMQFEDSGVAFNPLEQKMPDATAGIADRKIGGLGIFLTRKLAEEVVYQRDNEKNILTLHKTILMGE